MSWQDSENDTGGDPQRIIPKAFWNFNIGHLLIILGMTGGLAVMWKDDQIQLSSHALEIAALKEGRVANGAWEIRIEHRLETLQEQIGYLRGRGGYKQNGDN